MERADSVFSEKADENLNAAILCFKKEYYNSCVNRAYYAMFQIAAAILFKSGHRPKSKKIGHDWVQAEFTRLFVRRRKQFPHLKNFLNEVQKLRDTADYSFEKISKKKARRVLEKAKTFVGQVSEEVTDDA